MANLFGMGGGAEVYLTMSQSCGLEMVEVGKSGEIKSYAQVPLAYNEGQREIANYEEFKAALEEAFAKVNLNPENVMVHMSIPTVWFGARDGLPLLLDENSIGNAVLGELQKQYLFKTQVPVPFWFDNLVTQGSERNIFYTAVQATAAEQIKTVISSLGASLVSLECALFAYLRGLHVTGIATKQMEADENWSLMIVNNSGFQLVDMVGKKIAGYYEEPIAFKNYEGEEIYNAIDNAAQIAFMSTTSNTLVLVSETDLVSAQMLSEKLQFNGQLSYVEDNKFRMEPLMDLGLNVLAEDQLKVSLHAIGHYAPAKALGMPVEVNFIGGQGGITQDAAVIDTPFGPMTPQKALVMAAILFVIMGAIGFLAYMLTGKMLTDAQAKSSNLQTQIEEIDAQLAQYEGSSGNKDFNPVNEIENVLKYNRTKIMAYAALGESIPKNVYLTYFLTGDDGKINIKGCAETVEDVYVFYKNLKDSLVESNLRISKLDLKAGSLDKVVNNTASTIDDAPYTFEITNLTEDELKDFKDTLLEREQDQESSGDTESDSESESEDESN